MSDSAYAVLMRKERRAAKKVKDEVDAWAFHIEKLGLENRQEFIDWMLRHLTAKQLAIYIEMDWDNDDSGDSKRDYLHQVYMDSRYMGV